MKNSWALETIKDSFFKYPIRFTSSLNYAVYEVMKDYVVLKSLETPDGLATMQRAVEWLSKAIGVVSNEIDKLYTIFKEHETEKVERQLHDIYGIVDEIIVCLCSEVGRKIGRPEELVEEIPNELRCRFYNEVKPLMKGIITFALAPENGVMFPGTAHYFIQLLTSFLSCNPIEVLHLAEDIAQSSKRI